MPIVAGSNDGLASHQGIHVYHFSMSNCAQRVNLALAKKLCWTTTSINLLMRQNIPESYLKINPKGRASRIIHDGAEITESIGILSNIVSWLQRFKARVIERATL
jgi:ganglioside-induced differentiation-associated protein 1